MSRIRNSVSAQIRKKLKASQDNLSFRVDAAARKRIALDERFGRSHFVDRNENISVPPSDVQRHRRGIIMGTVTASKVAVQETSPGVYVVNVNSADPTGEQYFENSGRLERIRKIVAKKHARKVSPV